MYALVEIAGKQYKAEPGATLRVDLLDSEAGAALDMDSVLLVSDGESVKVGTPYVDGARVKATVTGHTKGDKVTVFKFKRRKNYRRKQGHRQQYSVIKVEEIVGA